MNWGFSFQYSVGDAVAIHDRPVGEAIIVFQYSVGDAKRRVRELMIEAAATVFQYSVGDAYQSSTAVLYGAVVSAFNTPLEMRVRRRGRQRLRRRCTFNTPLEMRPNSDELCEGWWLGVSFNTPLEMRPLRVSERRYTD